MPYWKIFLNVRDFDIKKTRSIYRTFEDELFNKNRYEYPHFTHNTTTTPQIVIKFHINKDNDEENNAIKQAIEDIIARIRRGEIRGIETGYITDNKIDIKEKEEWLMIAHHLASECILILMDRYNEIYQYFLDNPTARLDFATSFTHLFFKRLAGINLLKSDYENRSFKSENQLDIKFSKYIDSCVQKTEGIIKNELGIDALHYFANEDYNSEGNDFRMRFLHFICNCSLLCCWDKLYDELSEDLSVAWEIETDIGRSIAEKINEKMK